MSNYTINDEKDNIKEKGKIQKTYQKEEIPENFHLIINITDSYSRWGLDNTFIVFNLNNIYYLIYATRNKSIVSYNLNYEKKITEIKNAHKDDITNFRYYHQKKNNKNIIITTSGANQNIKLWDFYNWECILDLPYIYNSGLIFSLCIFNENNKQDYIITCGSSDLAEIRFYDFSGNYIKSIDNSSEKTLYIDYIFDKNISKYYIITGNDGYIKSYDYNENKLYHKYIEFGMLWHCSIKYIFSENILKLIDSCWGDDYIRIWNFHSGTLMTKIKTNGNNIKSIYIYNDNFIFIGCYDHSMKLIDINNQKVIKNFEEHKDWVLTIDKIIHPTYGECLLSQGLGKSEMIKIWKRDA